MPDIEEFYGQPNMNDKKSKTGIARASVTLTQEGDCCSGDDVQVLTISSDDGGGGWFWILETERWAFDSLEDLSTQLKKIIDNLESLKEQKND